MEITEVRIKLVGDRQDKLKAFCSITLDDAFVIRDLKIIEGSKGLFVAMPSRKLTARCQKCGAKNQIRSNYCMDCGYAMPQDRASRGKDGRPKLHADIAHPINSRCRELIQSRVINSYEQEFSASHEPGYRPKSIDEFEEDFDADEPMETVSQPLPAGREQGNRSNRQKSVEPDDTPPDDNFGAGIV